jgi:hypothetical protein
MDPKLKNIGQLEQQPAREDHSKFGKRLSQEKDLSLEVRANAI